MWAGLPEWPDDGNARMFAPPLMEQACKRRVSAVEITLDTTQWTTEWWSEIDAVRLDGIPDASHSDKGAKPGGTQSVGQGRARRDMDTSDAVGARRALLLARALRDRPFRRDAARDARGGDAARGHLDGVPEYVAPRLHVHQEPRRRCALAAGQKMGNASRNRGTDMAMEGEMRAMEILALVGDAGRPK